MSPNVGNFVHDLVEMAKAMETLPLVERQLVTANGMIENYAKQVQDREIAIIAYKQEIDDLHAKVRSLEVERDDASFRVLESEDLAHKALSFAKQAETAAAAVMSLLDPPKPEPVKEPEPTIPEAVHSIEPDWKQDQAETSLLPPGQSESSPTVASTEASSLVASNAETQTIVSIEPTHGPYSGKRYHDLPTWMPLSDWLAGGGTEADYFWRPSYGHIGD